MTKRNGNGQGSISKLGNKYRWQITIGINEAGKPIRKGGTCKTKTEARAKIAQALTDLSRGQFLEPAKVTVGEWIDRWLILKRNQVISSTFHTMEIYLRSYLTPQFRNLSLQGVKPSHILELDADLIKMRPQKPLSQATRSKTISFLRAAFNMAIDEGLLIKNPALRIRVHATEIELSKDKSKALSSDELSQFLSASKEHPLYALFYTLFSLALRRGEALGLRWDDIDFDNQTIRIERQLSMDGNKVTIRAPKTQASKRLLYLSDDLKALLERHAQEEERKAKFLGLPWKPERPVFTNTIGTSLHPRNVNRTITEICKAHSLRRFASHAGRHTSITMRLQAGQSVEVVAAIAGHTDINTTLTHYRTVEEQEKRKAVLDLTQCLRRQS